MEAAADELANGALDVRPGDDPKLLAFYLPQFHPIPENDAWWGTGFTEWRNVVRGRPLFPGHYQPHIPADLGFYDLRMPEVREAQALLARAYGIAGFCYYHYWFSGRRILERPFAEVLASGSPNFPFCLAWANEPWSRNWDGGSRELLIAQHYSEADDIAHIRWLIEAFKDPRYITVAGRPLFLVYNIFAFDDPAKTVDRWRNEVADAGLPNPYLVQFDTFGHFDDPALTGCDAASEFLPHGVDTWSTPVELHDHHKRWDYRDVVRGHLRRPMPAWKRYQCIFPGWDNAARKPEHSAFIYASNTPAEYEAWLQKASNRAKQYGHEFVFINAWNEWAEGAHLEPDLQHGRAYLEATARVAGVDPSRIDLSGVHRGVVPAGGPAGDAVDYHRMYEEHKLSAALEIEYYLNRIQDLEDGSAGIGQASGYVAELEARLAAAEGSFGLRLTRRLGRLPVLGRFLRFLGVLRREWHSL
jgi:lipopolysaccharide biosynthesis protein